MDGWPDNKLPKRYKQRYDLEDIIPVRALLPNIYDLKSFLPLENLKQTFQIDVDGLQVLSTTKTVVDNHEWILFGQQWLVRSGW